MLITIVLCILILTGSLLLWYAPKATLDSWHGNYFYIESFPREIGEPGYPIAPSISYNLYIYQDNNGLHAKIYNWGWQTNIHIRANVIGSNRKIDFLFESYLEHHVWGEFRKGDLLFSLSLDPSDNLLYTTWHGITSETALSNGQSTGVYFEKNAAGAQPQITYLTDSLMEIKIGAGTGLSLVQYYDVENDVLSETFESPELCENGRVVYAMFFDETYKLIVRDVFDTNWYYRELALDCSLVANPADALRNVEFVDENLLRIVYISGGDYEEKTMVLDLS